MSRPRQPGAPPTQILADLWSAAAGQPAALEAVSLSGSDPVLPSSFRIGAMAQTAIAASALAAAELWRLRTGRRQGVAVDMRHAAVEFRSERHMRLAGKPPVALWDKIAGVYRTRDGRWVRLHTNFPHHRDGMLKLLGCAYEREAVQAALMRWDGKAFETAAAEAGLVATMMRTPSEWAAHPQGQAVSALPLFEITRIGEAPSRRLPPGERPLSGIRVLDLTRVIAGPVCGRTLAAHGADVMRVTAAHLPALEMLDIDTGRGKLSADIDLRAEEERERLRALLREAQVFVQAYRPGSLAGRGFSPEACAEMRPGIVVVTLSAYGHEGPWAARRGFDSLVQTASGLNHAEAEAAGVAGPKELPAQALDHASGYLMAFGAVMALARKAHEGGSWHVRISLAQAGHWLAGLGRTAHGFDCADPRQAEVADLLDEMDTPFGRMTYVRHAAALSETPARWERPPVKLGSHAPVWPVPD
ncbi:MAG: CoA transferase [Hyphomicrobiaceae bacterium]|nr:MAG: CoA transferase [Hyphomicrobiaceae bacterium]